MTPAAFTYEIYLFPEHFIFTLRYLTISMAIFCCIFFSNQIGSPEGQTFGHMKIDVAISSQAETTI